VKADDLVRSSTATTKCPSRQPETPAAAVAPPCAEIMQGAEGLATHRRDKQVMSLLV